MGKRIVRIDLAMVSAVLETTTVGEAGIACCVLL